MLYLIEILHQTTTESMWLRSCSSCILSKFYIKPQRWLKQDAPKYVVSYRNSTSNHNNYRHVPNRRSVVSYRNSTSNHNAVDCWPEYCCVVSYRNSTSNHNTGGAPAPLGGLYLIEILHQTTTVHFHVANNR